MRKAGRKETNQRETKIRYSTISGVFCQTSHVTNSPGVLIDPLLDMVDPLLGTPAKDPQQGFSQTQRLSRDLITSPIVRV
jgi:hypothetical protein